MMTRKDYVAIAHVLKSARPSVEAQRHNSTGRLMAERAAEAVDQIAIGLANIMAADNPRFDRERFMRATT